jgi:hypothetical protein
MEKFPPLRATMLAAMRAAAGPFSRPARYTYEIRFAAINLVRDDHFSRFGKGARAASIAHSATADSPIKHRPF